MKLVIQNNIRINILKNLREMWLSWFIELIMASNGLVYNYRYSLPSGSVVAASLLHVYQSYRHPYIVTHIQYICLNIHNVINIRDLVQRNRV